jgi:DNA mismatch repair protein MutS
LSVLKSTLEMLSRLQEILMNDQSSAQSSYLQDLSSRLSPLDDIVSLIERSIMEDPPVHVRDGGVIRDGYDPEIDQLRELLRDGRGWISRLEGSEKERTGIKSLKIAFNNVFGYYIEVSRANLHLVPQDYIRKQTLANGERFVTPELKDMESRVLSAQERSVSLEQELFYQVRDLVARKAGAIQDRATALAELDVLISLATSAKENNMIRPEFNQEGRISIRSSRHPVLDKAMRGAFVPNDVLLDTDRNRLIILTGPNMAGKSTFMRQIALTAIMAQTGSFVPAAYASLTLVDQVFTRVGAYDDLSAGQSTFMVEMTEIAHILTSATRKSLVLLDEVGRGTSTFDGLSLAWAISEYLHESIKCKSVFATHYHQLTDLESILSGVRNYSIAVKEDKGAITFLRTVVPGATDKSYGVHVARLAGVPRTVTKRADQILREIEKEALMQPGSGRRSQRRSSRYTQLIFFDGNDDGNTAAEAESEKKDPILEEIESLDLDMMTPREALDRLAQYQRMQREREEG